MAKPLIKTRFFSHFEPRPLNRAVDRMASKLLERAGANVRNAARWSLGKRAKKPADPGTPPRSQTKRLKKSIRYALDKGDRTVVIGPMGGGRRYSGKTVPQILEYGARGVRMPAREIETKGEAGRNAAGQFTRGGSKKIQIPARSQDYDARPFMGPALKSNVPRFPSLFANGIKNG